MTEVKLRERYRGLSRQELLDKAYEMGRDFEMKSQVCSQSTVAALHELLEIDDVVVKVSTSLLGGSALQGVGTCGGLAGGCIVLDYYFGRPVEKMSYQERIQANIDAVGAAFEAPLLLADKYWKEYGTIICAQIQRQLFGRFYYLIDPEEFENLEKAGAHSDPKKCGHIIGNAARWVMEVLLDRGAIKL